MVAYLRSHICSCGKYFPLPSDIFKTLSIIYDEALYLYLYNHYHSRYYGEVVLQSQCQKEYFFVLYCFFVFVVSLILPNSNLEIKM